MSLAFKIAVDEVWDLDPASSPPRALCLGFTLTSPTGFAFDGMVHRGDRAGTSGSWVRLFRPGTTDTHFMRVNIILPDSPHTQCVEAFHLDPVSALFKAMPGLRRELHEVSLFGPVEIIVFTPH